MREDFWIAENAGFPVRVDAALEIGVCFGDLTLELGEDVWVEWWSAAILRVDVEVWDGVEGGDVVAAAGLFELGEGLDDVLD